jgi:hypothetical protein
MAMALELQEPRRGFVGGRILNPSLHTSQFKVAFLILDETPPLPLSAPVPDCHGAGLRMHPVCIVAQSRCRAHIRCADILLFFGKNY